MRRLVLATGSLALAGALLAAGGAAVPLAEPHGGPRPSVPVLTQTDHGRTVALQAGRTATLRVRGDGDLKVSGGSVTVSEVLYFADPGFREWELRAARAGTSVITAPRAGGGSFTVTIRVTTG